MGARWVSFTSGAEGADTDLVAQLLAGARTEFTAADLGSYYVDTLERRAAGFAEVVELLAKPDRLPALIHCSAGKDRTGLAVALVLELLGTPRRRVVDDYALTGVLRPRRWRAYEDLFRDAGVDVQRAKALFETPRSSMTMALEHLDRRFGGPRATSSRRAALTPRCRPTFAERSSPRRQTSAGAGTGVTLHRRSSR